MRSTTGRLVITWLTGLGGLGVVLFLTVALLLPRVLDSQAVKERSRTFLSIRITGAA
jgi:hypothetical protein